MVLSFCLCLCMHACVVRFASLSHQVPVQKYFYLFLCGCSETLTATPRSHTSLFTFLHNRMSVVKIAPAVIHKYSRSSPLGQNLLKKPLSGCPLLFPVSVRWRAKKKQGLQSFCFSLIYFVFFFEWQRAYHPICGLVFFLGLDSDGKRVFIAQSDHQLWFKKRIKHIVCFFYCCLCSVCCENNHQQQQKIKKTTPTTPPPRGQQSKMPEERTWCCTFSDRCC